MHLDYDSIVYFPVHFRCEVSAEAPSFRTKHEEVRSSFEKTL